MIRRIASVATILAVAVPPFVTSLVACGSSGDTSIFDGGGVATGEGGPAVDDSGGGLADLEAGQPPSTGDAGTPDGAVFVPPPNVVSTEYGGYALGTQIVDGGADNGVQFNVGGTCDFILGVVRDVKYKDDANGTGHPDFGRFHGDEATKGLVLPTLGTDMKPVYAGICDDLSPDLGCPYGQQLTTKANFDQWYRGTPGVNIPFGVYFKLVPYGGVYTFQSDAYFPVDNAGWGNNGPDTSAPKHNYGFTTEVHVKFTYNGGEKFTFVGDDDVWVFINGKMPTSVDLGGLHVKVSGTVELDTLGLVKGQEYPLDLFHAERAYTQSNFRIDTNLAFTSCGVLVPDPGPIH